MKSEQWLRRGAGLRIAWGVLVVLVLSTTPTWAEKSKGGAHVLALIPGLGHVYAGEPATGLAIFAGEAFLATAIVGMGLSGGGDPELFQGAGFLLVGVYFWQMYDAGKAVERQRAPKAFRQYRSVIPLNPDPRWSVGFDVRRREMQMSWQTRF